MKREEQWEVWGSTKRIATGYTRHGAILGAVAAHKLQAAGVGEPAQFIAWFSAATNSYAGYTVRRVTEPTKADKLIARMADFELQLMAMRDDLIEELNKP